MNKNKAILLSAAIVLTNSIISHFLSFGLLLTPIVLILISVLIGLLTTDLNPIWKSVLLAGLVILHDIGIKLYSTGNHDLAGLSWVHFMLLIGLIPGFVILIAGIFKEKNTSILNKWIAFALFPLIIWGHLLFFYELGLGRHY